MPLLDQVTQPNRRSRATPRQILDAFHKRILGIQAYSESTAFISDQPIPTAMPSGRHACSVSFSGGQFNARMFANSGHEQAVTEASIIIGIFVQNMRERIGKAGSPMLDDDMLFDRMHKVLACLTVADPTKGKYSQSWEPVVLVDGATKGTPLLRSIPAPTDFTDPSDVPGHAGWMGMTMRFGIEFDWDLYV